MLGTLAVLRTAEPSAARTAAPLEAAPGAVVALAELHERADERAAAQEALVPTR